MSSVPSHHPTRALPFLADSFTSPGPKTPSAFVRAHNTISHSTGLCSPAPTYADQLHQPLPSRTEPPPLSPFRRSQFDFAREGHYDDVEGSRTAKPFALQLSFDAPHPHPPPSGRATYSSVAPSPTTFSTPPLQPFDLSVSDLSPDSTSFDGVQSSPSTTPSYVHTFTLALPATPPSSASNARSLPASSASLSAALAIIDGGSPWNGRSPKRDTPKAPVETRASSLFTTIDSAAETLRRPVVRNYLPVELDASSPPTRPKPFRSSTEPYPSSTNDPSPLAPKSPSRSKGKKRPEGHIPRAPNAWILYRSARVKQLTETGKAPKLQSDLSKIVGTMWREESAEVKDLYARKASIEAQAFAEKYPGYCYKPARSKRPRRSSSKKDGSNGTGRTRSNTTSSLEAHLSGFSVATSKPPRAVPSVLLPSPFAASESFASANHVGGDYSVDGSYSYDDDEVTGRSMPTHADMTLPSTPNSSASEAWTVFQASGIASYDYGLPSPASNEPYSAPAHLSTFPFSFSQPPPIFAPFNASPENTSPLFESYSSSTSTSSGYPSLGLPETPAESAEATYDDFLANLPVDQSGQVSIPVSSSSCSMSAYSGYDFGDEQYQDLSSQVSPPDYSIDLSQFLCP